MGRDAIYGALRSGHGGALQVGELGGFSAADVAIFVLTDWHEALGLPFANRLAPVYARAATEPPESAGFATWESFNDGSQMGLVFIRPTRRDAACIAEIFYRALRAGFNANGLQPSC